jgi:8-oxo-dGTP diphosphatase
LEETALVLADDVVFVSAENNFFPDNTPQRHYVTMCLAAYVINEENLENTEPDKCEGWEWASATDLVDDSGKYRPLFVPLRHIFEAMGLIEE